MEHLKVHLGSLYLPGGLILLSLCNTSLCLSLIFFALTSTLLDKVASAMFIKWLYLTQQLLGIGFCILTPSSHLPPPTPSQLTYLILQEARPAMEFFICCFCIYRNMIVSILSTLGSLIKGVFFSSRSTETGHQERVILGTCGGVGGKGK